MGATLAPSHHQPEIILIVHSSSNGGKKQI